MSGEVLMVPRGVTVHVCSFVSREISIGSILVAASPMHKAAMSSTSSGTNPRRRMVTAGVCADANLVRHEPSSVASFAMVEVIVVTRLIGILSQWLRWNLLKTYFELPWAASVSLWRSARCV